MMQIPAPEPSYYETIDEFPTPATELAKATEQRKRDALSHSQRMRLRKEQEAERQAELRAKRKASRIPDPRYVDTVIVAALRSAIRRPGSKTHADGRVEPVVWSTVSLDAIVKRAERILLKRDYSPEATKAALISRLAPEQA